MPARHVACYWLLFPTPSPMIDDRNYDVIHAHLVEKQKLIVFMIYMCINRSLPVISPLTLMANTRSSPCPKVPLRICAHTGSRFAIPSNWIFAHLSIDFPLAVQMPGWKLPQFAAAAVKVEFPTTCQTGNLAPLTRRLGITEHYLNSMVATGWSALFSVLQCKTKVLQ